ncbi:MAG: UDP-N-acetylmuramoyl-L-alanyl-D-glutamate--2,6-diaminopimelate ligase [Oleiphilaceae bacterium]|jgi:UDP-N-acetylmuramoyl-L-alanyl-D-glutamate--2,6-diaminopimelate ligase
MMMQNSMANSKSTHRNYTSELVQLLCGICDVPSVLNTQVHGIQVDSRKVKKGDLFLALSDSHSASTDHIIEAIELGANAVVAEGTLFEGRIFEEGGAVELFVDNLKFKVGEIADRFFQSPSKDIDVIGVTGTNGKTSVTSYLASYFLLNGTKSGFIGTLGYGLSGGSIYTTDNTTPNVVDVHRYLAELRDQQVNMVAMEVSSHGLMQGRTDNVHFVGAVFTNLTREHLDYHGTMDSYAEAKSQLFKCKSLRFVVINNDDPYAEAMLLGMPEHVNVIRYGITTTSDHIPSRSSDIAVASYELGVGISADVNTPLGPFSIKSRLIGRFNLSNLLAVVGVAIASDHRVENLNVIKNIDSVVGRMEVVKIKNQAIVVVDYAHTPDALENALEALRPHCSGLIFLVFGCGGDRDVGKRAEMAAIGETLADHIIVTDDNPRNEDPEKITNDIIKGFKSQAKVSVIHSRTDAISRAMSQAMKDDVILIAGKGHETWQEIKGEQVFFSDMNEVKKYSAKLMAKARQNEGGGND